MKRSGQQTLTSFFKKQNVGTKPLNDELNENAKKDASPVINSQENSSPQNAAPVDPQSEINASPVAKPKESDSNLENLGEKQSQHGTDTAASDNRDSQAPSVSPSKSNSKENTNLDEWKSQWVASLTPEQKELLSDEIEYIGESWLKPLSPELTKPYFKNLKKFLKAQNDSNKKVFPPKADVYSWSNLCRLEDVKVVILGQDPYHGDNQAHGLAFSVLPPTAIPPSLRNIYKELGNCYPDYKKPTSGLLTPWAKQGVLLLNACLTVQAHKANSHSKHGWETFTEKVLELVARNDKVVFMAWGTPAFNRVSKINPDKRHLVLKSVHPSPLSASRGWFGSKHFITANEWLEEQGLEKIDWQV